MDDLAFLALWTDVTDVTDVASGSVSSMMENNPSPSLTVDGVDWDDILPLRCERSPGFAVFSNVRKAVGRRCCELLPAEAQQRLIANVPVFLSVCRSPS